MVDFIIIALKKGVLTEHKMADYYSIEDAIEEYTGGGSIVACFMKEYAAPVASILLTDYGVVALDGAKEK